MLSASQLQYQEMLVYTAMYQLCLIVLQTVFDMLRWEIRRRGVTPLIRTWDQPNYGSQKGRCSGQWTCLRALSTHLIPRGRMCLFPCLQTWREKISLRDFRCFMFGVWSTFSSRLVTLIFLRLEFSSLLINHYAFRCPCFCWYSLRNPVYLRKEQWMTFSPQPCRVIGWNSTTLFQRENAKRS